MKNIFITIVLLLTFSNISNAQNQQLIENVTWEFTDQKMIIFFDLISPDDITDRRYNLGVEVILDNGSFKPSTGLSGHMTQLAGKQRKIVWYYTAGGRTQRELDIPETEVKIFITKATPKLSSGGGGRDRQPSSNLELPSMVVPSVAIGVGTGAIIYGIILEKKGKELYDQYISDTSSNRDEVYDKANKKHIPAQYLKIGGGIITATGIYLLAKTLKKRKAVKNKLSIIPATGDVPYLGSNIGIGIQYSF